MLYYICFIIIAYAFLIVGTNLVRLLVHVFKHRKEAWTLKEENYKGFLHLLIYLVVAGIYGYVGYFGIRILKPQIIQ